MKYWQNIAPVVDTFLEHERKNLEAAATDIFNAIRADGIWHLFGSGHSQLMVEEAFHRAGGLVPVNPITEFFLSPLVNPAINRVLERSAGIGTEVFNQHEVKAGEPVWVFSNSGINSTSVDVALAAKAKEARVVAITSVAHSSSQKSRHPSGKRLYEVADIVLDTHVPPGDALCSVQAKVGEIRFAAGSSIVSTVAIHTVEELVIERFVDEGLTPPVYISSNIAGGDEHNKALEHRYKSRIRRL